MAVLEICALNLDSALAAQDGGAQRIELCENLGESGTTPSYGMIKTVRRLLNIELCVLIRPRAGDLVFNANELEIMLQDIAICGELGCDGIVIGALTPEGRIDIDACKQMINKASDHAMGVTFHRGFDIVPDQSEALEQIISMGCERILTSGGKKTAIEGAPQLRNLVKQANGRIQIMAGGGVSPSNAAELLSTGVDAIHASAKKRVGTKMSFINEEIRRNDAAHALYSFDRSDLEIVKQLAASLQC